MMRWVCGGGTLGGKKDGGGEMFFLLNTYNTGPYNPQPPYSIRP